MSYTELYQVLLDGNIAFHSEYHNSWRGAFFVWNSMSQKYFNRDAVIGGLANGDMQPVWDLYKDKKIPLELRVTMASTFDYVMVKKENIPFLINSFQVFKTFFGYENNIVRQIPELQELYQGDDTMAICWNQTSVNFSPWLVRTETDDNRPYNVFHDDRHWFLFDEDIFDKKENQNICLTQPVV